MALKGDKKQSTEEMKEVLFELVDTTGCDAIRDDLYSIFQDENISIQERTSKISRQRNVYNELEVAIEGKFTQPLSRNGKEFFLSQKSLLEIITRCNSLIDELERMEANGGRKDKQRPAFMDLLNIESIEDKEHFIQKLKPICNVESGKMLAQVVKSLEELNILLSYKSLSILFDLLEVPFPNIGSKTGFQDQYKNLSDPNRETKAEINQLKRQIKSFL